MKKQVRIRKALPGETPGYYNKTAKFLKKAAMGMEVAAPSMDSARLNQIYDQVYISLKNDATPDILYNQLINEYGLDESTSVMLIKSAMSKLAEEGYVDPELVEDKAETEEAVDPQIQANEDNERAASDAEQEELAISDGGLYDEEAAQMNQNSALEMTQDEEEGAFKYGGYFEDGGEYPDFEAMNPYEEPSMEQSVMDQYSTPGRTAQEKPFSMEDLIAMTPGTQEIQAFPDLASYLGDYRGSYDSYQPEEYLPKAQFAGAVKKGAKAVRNLIPTIKYFDKVSPLTNMSAIRKALPVFTGVGDAMTKIPYLGKKFAPKLETTFTQNRTELWNVLNGATPKTGVFSQSGTYAGGADGSLSADRLMLYQDDVKNIIQNIQTGKSAFTLADIGPKAEYDGLVSGIYPMDAKVISGTDDNGFQFFELKHTFGPNQRLPFGTTPAKAKEITFKNRFYFNNDPDTGELKVFDPLGNPLTTGAKTKYDITRPLGTSYSRLGKYFTTDAGLLETNTYDKSLTGYEFGYPQRTLDQSEQSFMSTVPNWEIDRVPQYSVTGQFGTPYPNYMDGPYSTGKGFLGNTMGRLSEVSDTAPSTLDRLGLIGKFGRGLETFGATGLNLPFRTRSANVKEMSLPVYGYRNAALGPDVIDPAKEGSYGSDIKNAINYKYRLGLKTTLIGGGLGYLGDKIYDAYNECQCKDANEPNFMAPDVLGKCPCGTDVGPSRVLDPTPIKEENTVDPSVLLQNDSMNFLKESDPSDYNYYRYQDPNIVNPNVENTSLPGEPDEYAKGGVTKNRFIKRMTELYAEGGDTAVGQGKRDDTLTNEIANIKSSFINTLKNNSNKALSKDIYKNAQGNPEILNILMQDGFKENLTEDAFQQEPMNTDPTAAFGGFIDMDAEDPLTRFIYGGDEGEYYEPYDLEQAENGMEIKDKSGKSRMVSDRLSYDEWLADQTSEENYPSEEDYDTWNTTYMDPSNESQRANDYSNYLDFRKSLESDIENSGVEDTKKSCGPGMAYSNTYKKCIPVSKINYIPREVSGESGWRNNLLPWNPLIQSQGSWVKQKGSPYYLNDGRSYNGLIPNDPVASYTTKKGLLGGRKKWIDVYQVDGDGNSTGVPMGDLEKLESMMDTRGRRNIKMPSINTNTSKEASNKESRRNQIEDTAKEKYDFTDQEWDKQSRGIQRNLRQAARYEQGRGARYNTNQAYEGAKNVVDNAKNTYGAVKSLVDKIKNPSFKQFGGPLPKAQVGNAGQFQGSNSFGNSFGNGFGQNTSSSNSFSMNNTLPNPFIQGADYTNPFTGKRPGVTVGPNGNYIDNQKQNKNPFDFTTPGGTEDQGNEYVGIERKRKNAYGFDGEGAVNAFNAAGHGVLGIIDRRRNNVIENNMLLDMSDPMNSVTASNQTDRGDWGDIGSKTGMFRYDETGSDRNSRATYGNYANTNARYGGYMQNGGYMDDEEMYMTPEELEQFLAAGGQVEYL
jgi:hypothetical protein